MNSPVQVVEECPGSKACVWNGSGLHRGEQQLNQGIIQCYDSAEGHIQAGTPQGCLLQGFCACIGTWLSVVPLDWGALDPMPTFEFPFPCCGRRLPSLSYLHWHWLIQWNPFWQRGQGLLGFLLPFYPFGHCFLICSSSLHSKHLIAALVTCSCWAVVVAISSALNCSESILARALI